ncbi:VCBS repeat-containing protein [Myxococcota bacterium]|nr:VCBS repeat-containing protein [Myxococcota bacterium]
MRTAFLGASLSLALMVACTEYEVNPNKDASGADDTGPLGESETDDSAEPLDACGELEQPDPASVELNAECDVELQTGKFNPVKEWKWGNGPFCGPAAVAQIVDSNSSGAIDDEDLPAVIVYQNNKVIALKGDGSGPFWASSGTGYGQDGGFAVGDIDNDGWPDVVTAAASQVCALSGQDGSQKWCTTGLASNLDPYGYNYPSIADMDGDGNIEVLAGNVIMRGVDGKVRGKGTLGKGAAPYGGTGSSTYGTMSVPVDMNNDGVMELVVGNAAYTPDGATIWSSSTPDGLVAVADFDGDGEGEIVKTSGVYVYGLETDGSTAWGPRTFSGNLGAPAADDMDGDGLPEFVFAAQNALIAMKWGGVEMWRATINDVSGAAGPVLFDFELDGYPEVLYADETRIQFFSGLDGSVKFTSGDHASYTILETPVVADVDNDDQVEIVLGHCNGNATIGAVTVYGDADETWPPGRKIWNQHGYSITNVEALGGIPSGAGNNFSTYNSFRSGDVGLPPSEFIDLRAEVIDVCEEECKSGVVKVAARALNAGNVEAPAGIFMTLRAGAGGEVLAIGWTTAAIPAGTSGEVITFEADASKLKGKTPVVTADEDDVGAGTVYECEESNNVESWTATVCD